MITTYRDTQTDQRSDTTYSDNITTIFTFTNYNTVALLKIQINSVYTNSNIHFTANWLFYREIFNVFRRVIEAFESGRVKIKFLPLLYMIEICSEDVFVLATQRGPELDYVWRRDVSLYGIFYVTQYQQFFVFFISITQFIMPNLVNLRSFVTIPCKLNCKAPLLRLQLASFYEGLTK